MAPLLLALAVTAPWQLAAAPAVSTPPVTVAQAEPAPPSAMPASPAIPPPAAPGPLAPSAAAPPLPAEPGRGGWNTVGLAAGFAYRTGQAGRDVGPAAGFALGATYDRTLVRFGRGDLALGLDFLYHRFATGETGSVDVGGGPTTVNGTRLVTQTSFVLLPRLGWDLRAARPWVGAGAGLGLGYFQSIESDLQPGDATATRLFLRAAAGIDLVVRMDFAVGLRVDYTRVVDPPPFHTQDGRTLSLFGDLADADVLLLYRF